MGYCNFSSSKVVVKRIVEPRVKLRADFISSDQSSRGFKTPLLGNILFTISLMRLVFCNSTYNRHVSRPVTQVHTSRYQVLLPFYRKIILHAGQVWQSGSSRTGTSVLFWTMPERVS